VGSTVVVAVDGTSGSGKSSTCRGVASRLGLRYLDTGAQFRAMTWYLLDRGVDVHDAAAVAARCTEPTIVSGTDPLAPTIAVDGRDVSGPIRSAEVTAAVTSAVRMPTETSWPSTAIVGAEGSVPDSIVGSPQRAPTVAASCTSTSCCNSHQVIARNCAPVSR